jgi:heme-degrading monooxygenase HmoA
MIFTGYYLEGHMLVRTWRGAVRAEDADTYVDYVRRTGIQAFRDTPGNLGSMMLRRPREDGHVELQVVSFWESMDSVRAFAGARPDRAVFFPEDDRFLVDRDWDVGHFEAVDARWPASSSSSSSPVADAPDISDARAPLWRWWERLVRMA